MDTGIDNRQNVGNQRLGNQRQNKAMHLLERAGVVSVQGEECFGAVTQGLASSGRVRQAVGYGYIEGTES